MVFAISTTRPTGTTYINNPKNKEKIPRQVIYLAPPMASLKGYRPYFGLTPTKDTAPPKTNDLKYEYFCLPSKALPDDYQKAAARALEKGENTIVTAPTGTGKTAIAYYIISKNFKQGKKTFYTTPLKALSNQKYNELKDKFGKDNVGILTGDRKENLRAPILVMTTEIYRNVAVTNFMSHRSDLMENLGTVVFDEFHYMGDLSRGKIWEESVIFTPENIQMLDLSATIGNPEDIKNWINTIKDKNTTLVEVPPEKRHVPLIFYTHTRRQKRIDEVDVKKSHMEEFADTESTDYVSSNDVGDVVKILKREAKLPAIVFVFSKGFARKLIEQAAGPLPDLNTKENKKKIKEILDKYKKEYGFYTTSLDRKEQLNKRTTFEEALYKGYATHSAGILPLQKQLIEELFNHEDKLIKVVFATETLAAGINMPARSVVLTNYKKNCGDGQERKLTSNEFHQMSGRAGRRNMDTIGHVIMMTPDVTSKAEFLRLAGSPPDNIKSQYKIDASLVAGFYENYQDDTVMKEIIAKSFGVISSKPNDTNKKIDKHMELFAKLRKMLIKKGFIDYTATGCSTNTKGEMVSSLKGMEQIPLVEAIVNKAFEKLTPTELAGIAAAIAVETHSDCSKIKPLKYSQSPEEDIEVYLSKMIEVRRQIDKLIREIETKTDQSGAKINAVALAQSTKTEDIKRNVDKLEKQIEVIRQETNKLCNEHYRKIMRPCAKAKKENEEKKYLKARNILIEKGSNYKKARNQNLMLGNLKKLLKEEEILKANAPTEKGLVRNKEYVFGKDSTYDEIAKIFMKYNGEINAHKMNMAQARLNPTAMKFVFKWAKLNEFPSDYKENWKTLCAGLTGSSEIRFEGDLYNAISQTIDFLYQLIEVSSIALKSKELREDFDYYNKLRENAKEAVGLLKQPPVYNIELAETP